ncbi:isochorismatase family protein [Candidatus Gracilibacteria bacterium]|nr:isochorismatase family protein [Candidatus Gracilibacteria bacterium]
MTTNEALIVVDYQNGFIPEHASGVNELPVEGGELLAPVINQLMRETRTRGGLVIATRDWHPRGHMSLARNYIGKNPFDTITYNEVTNAKKHTPRLGEEAEFSLEDLQVELGAGMGPQVLWPDHCIADTPGAEYFRGLDTDLIDHHIIKGDDPKTEMYSGFFGREMRQDDTVVRVTDILRDAGVEVVKIVGLATDFCVQSTAVDAVKNGFKTMIDKRAIAGVMVKSPEDTVAYLQKLRDEKGVEYI